jgi:hypothetical protein
MAQRPNHRVPFPYIHGLSKTDQFQLEEDFEYIVGLIPEPTAALFDAIIDPTLTASDPTQHEYVNLTELLANETWTGLFNVGVRQSAEVPIVEPLNGLSLAGKGDLSLFGLGAFIADVTHHAWDWSTITVPQGQQLFLQNLAIGGRTTSGGST